LGKLPTEAAYEAIFAEISVLPDEEIAPLNIDVVGAVTTVLGVLPALRALRPEIQDELPRFDLQRFDRLEQYALALNHANALHRGALVPRAASRSSATSWPAFAIACWRTRCHLPTMT
jgi:hypothetical protein